MSRASSADNDGSNENDGSNSVDCIIAAAFCDNEYLHLVLGTQIDLDLAPLAADFTLKAFDEPVDVLALDVHPDADATAITLLASANISSNTRINITYRPTQWFMCRESNGERIENFDEVIVPLCADDMSADLYRRLQGTKHSITNSATKRLEPKVFASVTSDVCIQLSFDLALDIDLPIDIDDFRAELDSRWLKIARVRFIKLDKDADVQLVLRLTEPLKSGEQITIGYRSPKGCLRTLDGAPLRSFSVSATVNLPEKPTQLAKPGSEAARIFDAEISEPLPELQGGMTADALFAEIDRVIPSTEQPEKNSPVESEAPDAKKNKKVSPEPSKQKVTPLIKKWAQYFFEPT